MTPVSLDHIRSQELESKAKVNSSGTTMDHRQPKRKESGAEGRKRRKLAVEEANKLSQGFVTYFKKPESAASVQPEELPGPSISFPVAAFSEAEDDVKTAISETVEMEEDEDISAGETEPFDKPESGELEVVKECSPAIPEVILKHDVGLLPFNKETQSIHKASLIH
uniref:Uncharacterized protein n=1 Tax=Sphaerodactylus townsendi TaxID=933632 RepID=A0ACB8EK89_9SAUR